MAVSRQKKEEIVDKLADIVKNAGSVVFVHFKGLSVADAVEMRQELQKNGVTFTVVKKSLLRRVFGASNLSGDEPELLGEIAVAYSDDAVAASKGVASFQKKLSGAFAPVGGIFEARFLSLEEVKALGAIPGRTELYRQLVWLMNAPIQQTVFVLNEVSRSFVGALDQIAQQKA